MATQRRRRYSLPVVVGPVCAHAEDAHIRASASAAYSLILTRLDANERSCWLPGLSEGLFLHAKGLFGHKREKLVEIRASADATDHNC